MFERQVGGWAQVAKLILTSASHSAHAGNGAITFSATMPASAPPVSIYAQGFVADAGGALGVAATNAVRITVQ